MIYKFYMMVFRGDHRTGLTAERLFTEMNKGNTDFKVGGGGAHDLATDVDNRIDRI